MQTNSSTKNVHNTWNMYQNHNHQEEIPNQVTKRFDYGQFSKKNVEKRTLTNVFQQVNKGKPTEAKHISSKSHNDFNQNESNTNNETGNFVKEKIFKGDSSKIFIGNIERAIKWYKIIKFFCYYEIYGPIISFQEGSVTMEKIMLLREKKGPVLQVIYYLTDYIDIENFNIGQTLRCVGIMIGPNIFRAVNIREAKSEELATLQRMCYISDHAITAALTR